MKVVDADKLSSIQSIPSLNDSYCWSLNNTEAHINANSLTRFTVITIISLSIIVSNFMFIVTINSQIYLKFSNQQTQFRYLLTCLAINDFSVGIFVTAAAVLPAIGQCWPFGETVCQIQASLRGILPRQSVVILMCTAVDRYISVRYPRVNEKCYTNKICMLTICLSLILFFSIFATLVISRQGFYFNNTGLLACDILYVRPSFRILSACMFYFPATMLFMYCYGSLYHFSYKKCSLNSIRNFNLKSAKSPQKREKLERQNKVVSRKMGLISFMFVVTTTPWFINEMVVGGTGYKVSSFFEFLFIYTALSNSFWNPFLYWALDKNFRSCLIRIMKTKDSFHEELAIDAKSLQYCHNHIDSIHVIDYVEEKFKKLTANNYLPNCPTPPPPPRLKQQSTSIEYE